jgi:hypothetical protein
MAFGTAVFTSIAANYLPKARVLAQSVKTVAPDAHFYLMLVDEPPADFQLETEPFDAVISLADLMIENLQGWVFSHSIVELCTAVKGPAAQYCLARSDCDRVIYFDPDMVVFDRFAELEQALTEASIVLTPHQSEPEADYEAVMDNEMASLKHGVFNMGFFGIAATSEGRRFADWWSERLKHFCLDDIERGLFTDQKWANLIPCFFDDYRVLRSPAFNVATWNITTRRVEGTLEAGVTVNGESLGFYHFSGFDSGDQELMLNKYGAQSDTLKALRAWYLNACEAAGQSNAAIRRYQHGFYENGETITLAARRLYRARSDLQHAFPDPFSIHPQGGYTAWYRVNIGEPDVAVSTLSLTETTLTRVAIHHFSQWLRQRALLHGSYSVKRFCLMVLVYILRLFTGGTR